MRFITDISIEEVGEARKVNGQRICDVKVVYRYVGSVDDALAQERQEAYEKAILYDHPLHFSGLHIRDHALEACTVERGPGNAVINIELDIGIPSVHCVFLEDFFLIDNAVAVALLFIVLG